MLCIQQKLYTLYKVLSKSLYKRWNRKIGGTTRGLGVRY